MPTPSGGGGAYRKIKFLYTKNEQERELEIYAKVVSTPFQLTSTALANFLGPSSPATHNGYVWEPIGEKKIYCKSTGGNDNTSYLEISQYTTQAPQVPEVTEILEAFRRWQVEIQPELHSDSKHILHMSLNPDDQLHTPDETGYTQKIAQAQQIETEDGAIARISLYTETEYEQGTPITRTYNSGIWGVGLPDTGDRRLIYAQPGVGEYNSSFQPSIGFWVIKVVHDNEAIDGNQYGITEECLFVMTNNYGTNPTSSRYQSTLLSLNIFTNEAVEDDPSSQNPQDTVTPGGWVATDGWDYTSDSDDVRAVSGHDYINKWKHGIRLYYISDNDANAFMDALWDINVLKKIEEKAQEMLFGANVDYIKGIVCLHKLPFGVAFDGTSPLTILGTELASKYSGLSAFRKIKETYGSVKQKTSEVLDVSYQYGQYTFMDWNHASAFVRLPFVGNVPIPIKYIRQGGIKVNYNIDVLTGNLIAQIFTKNYYGTQILYYQGSGNCAIPIPFSGNSEGGFKQLGTMVSLAGAAATGSSALLGAVSGMLQQMPTNTADYTYVQSETANLMDLTVKLVVVGDIPLMPPKQQALIGYSAGCTGTISNFVGSGITYGKARPDTIPNATAAEKDEIKALFERGVIL